MSLETYGRYQLLKKLATGGMAQIYLARQVGPEGFEKLLVVKRILPHLAENEEFITMFLDEARIAARLNHPNVVQIFDLGAQDDSFFIAMEFIHGEDVRRVWKHAEKLGKPIPTALICRIIIEACAGLDYAHKKTDQSGRPLGIVHRDISPQNILVSFEGGVKIVDFGIAKAADQATVTRSGVLKGKYSYMSPEQAGGKQIDRRTDIFALGVVLYELLTGARLFKRATDIQTLNAVTDCKVVSPSEVNTRVPKDLDAIVMKALAKERENRYSDARELGAALEAWLLANKLPSSSAELAGFMHEIYADRLEREREEGRLLVETLEASRGEDIGQATPPSDSKVSRHSRHSIRATPSLPRMAAQGTRVAEATAAERPGSRSGAISKPRSLDKLVALGDAPPGRTEASMPTQSDGPPKRLIAGGAIGVGLVAIAVLAFVFLRGPAVVNVASTPPGASVSLGGKELCKTPCTLPQLAAGQYTFDVAKEGFEPIVASVTVPKNGELDVPAWKLKAVEVKPIARPEIDAGVPEVVVAKVRVQLESEPAGAKVLIDGAEVGRTPHTLEAERGVTLALLLELEGRVPVVDKFVVGEAPEERHAWVLKPAKKDVKRPPVVVTPPVEKPSGTGTVRFVVKPWATVDCGAGYKFGDTPFADKPMPVGEYRCTFTNPELGQKTESVKVAAGTLVKVQVNFGQ